MLSLTDYHTSACQLQYQVVLTPKSAWLNVKMDLMIYFAEIKSINDYWVGCHLMLVNIIWNRCPTAKRPALKFQSWSQFCRSTHKMLLKKKKQTPLNCPQIWRSNHILVVFSKSPPFHFYPATEMVMFWSQKDESIIISRVPDRSGWHRCGAVCLMSFLFLEPSLALLEAKLCLF